MTASGSIILYDTRYLHDLLPLGTVIAGFWVQKHRKPAGWARVRATAYVLPAWNLLVAPALSGIVPVLLGGQRLDTNYHLCKLPLTNAHFKTVSHVCSRIAHELLQGRLQPPPTFGPGVAERCFTRFIQ
jgi:hypothetical protein